MEEGYCLKLGNNGIIEIVQVNSFYACILMKNEGSKSCLDELFHTK
jgi:hypothetical protein